MIGTLAAIARHRLARVGCWMWGHDWHEVQRTYVSAFFPGAVAAVHYECGRCGEPDVLCS